MSDNEKSTQTEEPNFRYNAALAQDIENKWQKIWDEQGTFWAANVNGDDAIDAVDAFAIQRFVHYGVWA